MLKKHVRVFVAALYFLCALGQTVSANERLDTGEDELREIVSDAYMFGYPLVLMEMTRRQMTSVAEALPDGSRAPMNQFARRRTFPDANFTTVVRPNADTLYTTLWFDVSEEPLILDIPASDGRYWLLPMLDMWTDVFASPGSRTTGNGAQSWAVTAPGWDGPLPEGVGQIASPTAMGWILGRVATVGGDDFQAANAFQDGIRAMPLSSWPDGETEAAVQPSIAPELPPPDAVEALEGAAFFSAMAELLQENPPHLNDTPMMMRLARAGLTSEVMAMAGALSDDLADAVRDAPTMSLPRIQARVEGTKVNGWSVKLVGIGTYGTDYLGRARIAYAGLGANTPEDAIYPAAYGPADGTAFDSGVRYVLRFPPDALPPVRGFWSLTMYDERQLFTSNPLGRYAIGDRSGLVPDPDGGVTILIQREDPGPEEASNWLPAPEDGTFSLNLRLYWPTAEALDLIWSPPPVTPVTEP